MFKNIGFDIKKNHLIQTFNKWVPNYKVEFNIKVLDMPQDQDDNDAYEVLHFTTEKHEELLKVSVINEFLQISSSFDGGRFIYDHQYELDKEYNVTIQQNGSI